MGGGGGMHSFCIMGGLAHRLTLHHARLQLCSHPLQGIAGNHPNSRLLGFSAALAP